MAEASKVSGEKYRRIFSEYDPVFVDAVSSAALSCNLNFFLKKEQMHALSEYVIGKDVVVNLPTGYGKSLIYSLCPLVCDNLRNVNSPSILGNKKSQPITNCNRKYLCSFKSRIMSRTTYQKSRRIEVQEDKKIPLLMWSPQCST